MQRLLIQGCELYDVCMKNGLLDLDFINTCDFSDKSVIRFSEDFQEDIRGLIRTFNLYIRLPEKYYAEISLIIFITILHIISF